MHLARVIGRVVATVKDKALENIKLLLIQSVDHDQKPKGKAIISTDQIQSGQVTWWLM
ncbi:MAG TPA: EutN/CcmL family microcompartment protein [Nitrospinota bacterium]|nr:EutN/CcmL family microcompartment protein [Nitrospinota bacterium]